MQARQQRRCRQDQRRLEKQGSRGDARQEQKETGEARQQRRCKARAKGDWRSKLAEEMGRGLEGLKVVML
jgi:hypothetical protein